MRVFNVETELKRLPIFLWLDDIEDEAIEQARNLAFLPFAFHHIAIMPDAHKGYGMPIGGVMATKGVIVPNAVGLDIGCGTIAVKTSIKVKDIDIKKLMGRVRNLIPVGFKHHEKTQEARFMPDIKVSNLPIVSSEYKSALRQLGTLGGGNHFIEFQKDNEKTLWIMIHSGSRNLGKKVAEHYNNLAKELNHDFYSEVPKEWDLAFLPLGRKEAKHYLEEMNYCVKFALKNRERMMDIIMYAITDMFVEEIEAGTRKDWSHFEKPINIAHNYASIENHFGQNVWIHRKGATSARLDELGIIPGSQGTASYIVKGLGNPESFMSCSHGSGRKMGRNQAIKDLNLQEEIKKLDDQGIIHGIRNQADLDEASGSYKDIEKVMNNQKGLVKIVTKLEPVAVIKG